MPHSRSFRHEETACAILFLLEGQVIDDLYDLVEETARSGLLRNSSMKKSWQMIVSGFPCSICHNAHGMGAVSPSVTGERLINFDVNVVAQNGSSPISYNRATNTCTSVCHGEAHSSAGVQRTAVRPVLPRATVGPKN